MRSLLASTRLLCAADGRIVLTVDVGNRLRFDTSTSPEPLCCLLHGRNRSADRFIPSRHCSFVAALDFSWHKRQYNLRNRAHVLDRTADHDTARSGGRRDRGDRRPTRKVVTRARESRQCHPGDPDILIVMDTGYDVTRLARVLADLPVEPVGRLRPDPVILRDTAPLHSARRAASQARRRPQLRRTARRPTAPGWPPLPRTPPLIHGTLSRLKDKGLPEQPEASGRPPPVTP
nr:transposase [Streptomyces sp. NBC_00886]